MVDGRLGSLLRANPARRLLLAAALVLGLSLLGASGASAQSTIKVLVFTGPSDATTDAGVAALQALAGAHDFGVDVTQNAGAFSASTLAQSRAVVFLNTAGDRLDGPQESALQGYVNGGGGFVGIGSAAEAEPGSAFVDGLIGARPATDSPTTTSSQVVAVGDRVHPATRDLPLEWTRTDVWYRWIQRPTGQVHTVARYRAPGAPAGDGTSTGGAASARLWGRRRPGGRRRFTPAGRP